MDFVVGNLHSHSGGNDLHFGRTRNRGPLQLVVTKTAWAAELAGEWTAVERGGRGLLGAS